MKRSKLIGLVLATAGALSVATLAGPPAANADAVAYLVNVHVNGYGFPSSDAALGYGYSVCDRVAAKESYGQLVSEVRNELDNAPFFRAAYLINQSVNELCTPQISQLRTSAAGFTLPPSS